MISGKIFCFTSHERGPSPSPLNPFWTYSVGNIQPSIHFFTDHGGVLPSSHTASTLVYLYCIHPSLPRLGPQNTMYIPP